MTVEDVLVYMRLFQSPLDHSRSSFDLCLLCISSFSTSSCKTTLLTRPEQVNDTRRNAWYISVTQETHNKKGTPQLRQDPPLDLSFWSFLTFLHHGIEEVERHLLWKFYKNIRRKSWSNVPPKLLACIGFLYKVVHKIGRLRKFNRSREIEFNFLTAWTISMKFGTLVQHALGSKILPQIF